MNYERIDDRVWVSEEVRCRSCRIQLARETTLGSDQDSLTAGGWSSVVRNRKGEYFAAALVSAGSNHIRSYSTSKVAAARITSFLILELVTPRWTSPSRA